jgi:general secretion pathway protein G
MKRQAGLGKFEFLVVVAVIGFISWLGLERLTYLQVLGEKTAVETTILNIQTGLRYATAGHIIRGEEMRIVEMVGSNPVRWLEKPPQDYVGECAGEHATGRWCFDVSSRELRYRPRLDLGLQPPRAKPGVLSWRIERATGAASVRIVLLSPP